MARTDTDSWDLASSVGATATMVATARALATAEPDAIIDDPYAAPLVRAVGIDFFTKLVDGEFEHPDDADGAGIRLMTDVMAVRTRFFDDFFLEATGAGHPAGGHPGVRSRLAGLPVALARRHRRLRDRPAAGDRGQDRDDGRSSAPTPTADLRTVAIDLREDWPAALRDSGFDVAAPTAWSAEGLLVYLPPEAQDRLFDNITALSAPGSRLATEFHAGRRRHPRRAGQGDRRRLARATVSTST